MNELMMGNDAGPKQWRKTTDVEKVARIVDPYAFREGVKHDLLDLGYQGKALAKAREIIAALEPSPEAGGMDAILADQLADKSRRLAPEAGGARPCTCPLDEAPALCQQRYALSECLAASAAPAPLLAKLRADLIENARTRIAKVIALEEAGTCSRDTLDVARNDRDRALIRLGRATLQDEKALLK